MTDIEFNNTVIRFKAEGVMPDTSFLNDLDLPEAANITIINTAGNAWTKRDGGWKVTNTPWQPELETAVRVALPRILAITPYHPSYGIKERTQESIEAALMAYDGPIDWIISRNDNPKETGYENVTHQHNKARDIALAGGYDYLLSIEADMVIPADTIDRLLAVDADIAYGLYAWRHFKKRWNAYTELTLWGGTSVTLDHTGKTARDAFGRVIDVAGLGMGCTLIKRRVLEAMPFRLYDGIEGDWLIEHNKAEFERVNVNPLKPHRSMLCDDYLLALDAQHYGFSQRCDLGLVCGHVNGNTVIWPDPARPELYREEVLSKETTL